MAVSAPTAPARRRFGGRPDVTSEIFTEISPQPGRKTLAAGAQACAMRS